MLRFDLNNDAIDVCRESGTRVAIIVGDVKYGVFMLEGYRFPSDDLRQIADKLDELNGAKS